MTHHTGFILEIITFTSVVILTLKSNTSPKTKKLFLLLSVSDDEEMMNYCNSKNHNIPGKVITKFP